MNITLQADADTLRANFIAHFVLPYEECARRFAGDIHRQNLHGFRYNKAYYDADYMWNRIQPSPVPILFASAYDLLRSLHRDVIFMSEGGIFPWNCTLNLDGNQIRDFVAVADSTELAEQIWFEWNESYRLAEQFCYLSNPLLPTDLYIFDWSFHWHMIFTHETDDSEKADSRLCLRYEI